MPVHLSHGGYLSFASIDTELFFLPVIIQQFKLLSKAVPDL